MENLRRVLKRFLGRFMKLSIKYRGNTQNKDLSEDDLNCSKTCCKILIRINILSTDLQFAVKCFTNSTNGTVKLRVWKISKEIFRRIFNRL